MQNLKLIFVGVAILCFTSCSNDDSVNDETINPTITGLSVEASSGSSLSDRVLNFKSRIQVNNATASNKRNATSRV